MKKRISGWDIKLYLDDILFELINMGYKSRVFAKNGRKYYGTQNNIELKDKYHGKRSLVDENDS